MIDKTARVTFLASVSSQKFGAVRKGTVKELAQGDADEAVRLGWAKPVEVPAPATPPAPTAAKPASKASKPAGKQAAKPAKPASEDELDDDLLDETLNELGGHR